MASQALQPRAWFCSHQVATRPSTPEHLSAGTTRGQAMPSHLHTAGPGTEQDTCTADGGKVPLLTQSVRCDDSRVMEGAPFLICKALYGPAVASLHGYFGGHALLPAVFQSSHSFSNMNKCVTSTCGTPVTGLHLWDTVRPLPSNRDLRCGTARTQLNMWSQLWHVP